MNRALIIGAILIATVGCTESTSDKTTTVVKTANPDTVEDIVEPTNVIDFSPVAAAFHDQALIDSKNMLNHCAALQSDIAAFLAQPTDALQLAAQQSFLPCYQSWAAVSLFFQQPFDLADQKNFKNLIDLIDTRPSLPGYIDGIPEYPFSGLVHELDLPITADNLRGQHRLMDEESASVGFPVIEFFLWKMPVAEHWIARADKENETIVQRRKEYLLAVSSLLLDHLSMAVLRWQEDSRFDQLPERAQLSLVLKSLQRLTMVDLLAKQFEQGVFDDPLWHHPAPYSGDGRSYATIKLKAIQNFIGSAGNSAFGEWLGQVPNLNFTLDELRAVIATTITQVQTLPKNYPLDSKPDENWQLARQNLAQLTLDLSTLSTSLQVSIITE